MRTMEAMGNERTTISKINSSQCNNRRITVGVVMTKTMTPLPHDDILKSYSDPYLMISSIPYPIITPAYKKSSFITSEFIPSLSSLIIDSFRRFYPKSSSITLRCIMTQMKKYSWTIMNGTRFTKEEDIVVTTAPMWPYGALKRPIQW